MCARQTAVERQDLSCMYLAHHELESVLIIIIIVHVAATSCQTADFLNLNTTLSTHVQKCKT